MICSWATAPPPSRKSSRSHSHCTRSRTSNTRRRRRRPTRSRSGARAAAAAAAARPLRSNHHHHRRRRRYCQARRASSPWLRRPRQRPPSPSTCRRTCARSDRFSFRFASARPRSSVVAVINFSRSWVLVAFFYSFRASERFDTRCFFSCNLLLSYLTQLAFAHSVASTLWVSSFEFESSLRVHVFVLLVLLGCAVALSASHGTIRSPP